MPYKDDDILFAELDKELGIQPPDKQSDDAALFAELDRELGIQPQPPVIPQQRQPDVFPILKEDYKPKVLKPEEPVTQSINNDIDSQAVVWALNNYHEKNKEKREKAKEIIEYNRVDISKPVNLNNFYSLESFDPDKYLNNLKETKTQIEESFKLKPYAITKNVLPQFQKEEQSSTDVTNIPDVTTKELSPQYEKKRQQIMFEKNPIKAAEILKDVPDEQDREKIIELRPPEERDIIRTHVKLFEREHPLTGGVIRTAGAGIKTAASILSPSWDNPFESTLYKEKLGTIIKNEQGVDEFREKSADELKVIADQYRDDKGKVSVASVTDKNLQSFLKDVQQYEAAPEKQKKIKETGENLIKFGDYLDPVEIKAYRIDERIEKLKKNNPTYGAALERGDLKMAIEKSIGEYTISGNKDKAEQFIALNKKYDEATAQKEGEKRGILKNILVSSLEMFPPMAKTAVKGMVPGVGQGWSLSDWTLQGTGMVTNDLRKAGVTFETARKIAPLAGLAYAAVEFIQVGQITKLAGGVGKDAVKKAVVNAALKILKEKGVDYLHEVGEEGLQQFITDVGTDIGKKIEGKTPKGTGKILWDGLVGGLKASGQAAGPMALYTLLGVGASGAKQATETYYKKGETSSVEPAPLNEAETPVTDNEKLFMALYTLLGVGASGAKQATETYYKKGETSSVEPAPLNEAETPVTDNEKLFAEMDTELGVTPETTTPPAVEYNEEDKKTIVNSVANHIKKSGISKEESEKKAAEMLSSIPEDAARTIVSETKEKLNLQKRLYHDSALTGLKTRIWAVDNGYYTKNKETSGRRTEWQPSDDKPAIEIDIDNFKKVNDENGHNVGDEVLRKIGELLIKNIDDAGLGNSVRHGGEEIIIFPLQGKENDVIIKIGEIRDQFKKELFAEGNVTGLSFSAGQGLNYKEADRALYYAKETGRDKTVLSKDVPVNYVVKKKEKKDEQTTTVRSDVAEQSSGIGELQSGIPDTGVFGGRNTVQDNKKRVSTAQPGTPIATDTNEKRENVKRDKKTEQAAYDNGRAELDRERKSAEVKLNSDDYKSFLVDWNKRSDAFEDESYEMFKKLGNDIDAIEGEVSDKSAAFNFGEEKKNERFPEEKKKNYEPKKPEVKPEAEQKAGTGKINVQEQEKQPEQTQKPERSTSDKIDEATGISYGYPSTILREVFLGGYYENPKFTAEFEALSPDEKYKKLAEEKKVIRERIKRMKEENVTVGYAKLDTLHRKLEREQKKYSHAAETKNIREQNQLKTYAETGKAKTVLTQQVQEDTEEFLKRYRTTDVKSINKFLKGKYSEEALKKAVDAVLSGHKDGKAAEDIRSEIGGYFAEGIDPESVEQHLDALEKKYEKEGVPQFGEDEEKPAPAVKKEEEKKPKKEKKQPTPKQQEPEKQTALKIGDTFVYNNREFELNKIEYDTTIEGTDRYKFEFRDLSIKRMVTRIEVGSVGGIEKRFGIIIDKSALPKVTEIKEEKKKPEPLAPEEKRGITNGKPDEIHDQGAVEGGKPETGQGVEGERPTGGEIKQGGKPDGKPGRRLGKERAVSERGAGDSVPGFVSSTGTGGDRGARGDELSVAIPKSEKEEIRLIDYLIQESDRIGEGGSVKKTKDNLDAIKTLKLIEKEDRFATPQEQQILVHYVGWGGLSNVFKEGADENKFHNELKELLTEEEYASARRSTLNAHYTSPTVIQAIWRAVTRLGFNGGNVLEPAIGIGHFFGLRPSGIKMGMSGIEMDSLSARIAKQLYQNAAIQSKGYQNVKMPADYYQAIISNVPFSEVAPVESNEAKTSGVPKGAALHDFYFLKSLYGLQPGGLIAFVTTHYTMDKKDSSIRKAIAEQANFIGAIRLPSTAFKENAGTEVVTDVIFLQKRDKNDPQSESNKDFIESAAVEMDKQKGEPGKKEVYVNKYFNVHPEMVIGTQNLSGSMYGANQYNVTLNPGIDKEAFKNMINEAINNLPENIVNQFKDVKISKKEDVESKLHDVINVENMPFGSYFLDNGTVYQRDLNTGEAKKYEGTGGAALKSFVKIKEIMQKMFIEQRADNIEESKKYLAELNKEYDSFVKRFGALNSKSNDKLFRDDPSVHIVQLIEKYNEKKQEREKGAILKGALLHVEKVIDKSDSPMDALIVSLNLFGNINIDHIASMIGKTKEETTGMLLDSGLIFKSAEDFINGGNEIYISREEYLSGDVRQKLLNAKKALKKDKFFQVNVDALVAVQPLDIPFDKIGIQLNSPVLTTDDITDFIKKLLDTDNVKVIHNPLTGQYAVDAYTYKSHLMTRDYGTKRRDALKIIKDILADLKSIVYDPPTLDADGKEKRVINEKESAEAQVKNNLIKKEFSRWVWDDDERTKRLVRSFNDRFNAFVNRTYIHPLRVNNPKAIIKFVNSAFPYPAREHQADSVWRIIQSMRVLLAHEVGSGKTLEMIWGAAELKRMGFVKKPMFVFPNHMVKQWTQEYMQAYPAAKILVAQEGDLSKENRRRFINKIATGDWDAVLIKMQDFLAIPLSPAEEMEQTKKIIQQYKTFLKSITPENGKKDRSVKDLEKKIDKYETKITSLKNRVHKEKGTLYFDDLGVDMLLVDEADLFKNLEFFTTLKNVRGLGTQAGSGRAMDLYQKTQYLYKKNGRVVFATGTPISNTLVESYSLMRYLQPEWLHDQGIESFDDWQRLNAVIVTAMAPDNTGTSYKLKTYFANIQNARSLMKALRETWDIKTAKYLEDNKILVGGRDLPFKKIINIAAPLTDYMKSFKKYLVRREDNLKGKKPGQAGEDNVLVIIDDGKKAALDMRLFSSTLPDLPESKLNIAVNKIVEIYKKYDKQKYTQIVFCDAAKSYRKDENGKRILSFDAIKDIVEKLIKGGIKENEIAVISDKKYDKSKAKADMFQDMRDGKIRVLIGSVAKMGAGTNVQDLGKAIHFLDAKWRPRDFWQAIGRFVRQGNNSRDFDEKGNDITKSGMKGTVEIYNYATKGSLDTGIWAMLETKARAIENIMGSTENVDYVIEEEFFSSVKELSIEDPAMKEAMNVRYELKEMEAKEDVYIKNRALLKSDIKNLPEKIDKFKESIKKVKQDIEKRTPEPKGDDFKIVVGGVEYTKKTEAGEAIIKIMKDLSKASKEPQIVGNYAGFKLKVSGFLDHTGRVKGSVSVVGNFSYGGEYYEAILQTPLQVINALNDGVYNRMDNLLRSFEKNLGESESSLEKAKNNIDAPFEYNEEIKTKKERLKELDKILDEQKEKQAHEPDVLDIDWEHIRDVLPVDLSEGKVFEEEEGKEDQEPETMSSKGKPEFSEETRDMFEGVMPRERTPQQIEIEAGIKAKKGGKADVEALPMFEGGDGIVGGTEQLTLFNKGEPVEFKKFLGELKNLISPALWNSFDITVSDNFGPGNRYSFGETKEGRPITNGAVWKDARGFHVSINPAVRNADVSRIIIHEIMGHAGAINVLRTNKPVYKRISDLYRIAKYTDKMEKLREKYAEELAENPKFTEDIIFGEWIAYSMEDYIANPKRRGVAYQVWRTVRRFLIDIGITQDTIEDVMYAIAKDIKGLKDIQTKLAMKPMMQKTEKVAPTFFSPLQKAVSEIRQERGTGDQMFAMITKTPGVKEAEWKWVGLDDFLKGKQSVTKTEIEAFVRQNQVEIKEVEKGKEPFKSPLSEEESARLEELSQATDLSIEEEAEYKRISKKFKNAKDVWVATSIPKTKFSQYTLPGGENYREVLLTLPDKKIVPIERQTISYKQAEQITNNGGQVYLKGSNAVISSIKELKEYPDDEKFETAQGLVRGDVFRSSHWDEPNVIAHARLNDRTGPNGEKVLFIEEVQSDWSRSIREKGVASGKEYTINDISDVIPKTEGADVEFQDGNSIFISQDELELDQSREAYENQAIKIINKKRGVSDQPFFKNWEELTLKRILRMAAEEGYDRVAWINGEQTADRYDLSKNIKGVGWDTYHHDGGKSIIIEGLKGISDQNIEVAINKEGIITVTDIGAPKNWKGKKLSDVLGKGIADRILNEEKGEIKGEGLRVGGEWATNLYDRVIPKFFEKYGKKWNAKVEPIKLIAYKTNATGENVVPTDHGWSIVDGQGNNVINHEFETKEKANEWINTHQGRSIVQQSISITKAMEDAVLFEGQPMFSKGDIIPEHIPGPYEITEEHMIEMNKEGLPTGEEPTSREILDSIYSRVALEKEHPVKRYLGLEKSYKKIQDKVIADTLVPISTRLKRINIKLKQALRKFEFDYRKDETEDKLQVKPFLDATLKMSPADQRVLDLAFKNADKEKVNQLVKKYNLEDKYEDVRTTLDGIWHRAKEAGFDINYIKTYWPRLLLNYSGYLKEIQEAPEWGIIEKQLQKAQHNLGRPLTEKEKAEIADYIIGRPERIIDAPKNVKERMINIVDDKIDKYYDYSVSALVQYIHTMNQSIHIRKFLGIDKESQTDYQEKLTFPGMEKLTEDIVKNHITDVQAGIDKWVVKEIDKGNLTPEQQDELIGILRARFNYRPSGHVIQTFKDLGYIGAMGSGFSAAVTQIGDLAWAYYVGGSVEATKALGAAIVNKSILRKEDIGLDRIAEEFRTSRGLGRVLNKIFEHTGLTKFDNVGKETLINSALNTYFKQAQTNNIELLKTLQDVFGYDTGKEVLNDLKTRTITDNVKLLLFSRLLDFQPMALSEMPLLYLKSPLGRVFYMLKTFTIKQLDVFRNESIDLITAGVRNQNWNQVARGLLNLGYLTMLFVAANAAADEIKDWIFGRKPSFEDKVWDNIFRLLGLSRFIAWEARREGPVSAFWKLITPPMDIIEAPLKDVWSAFKEDGKDFDVKVKNFESWKLIPYFGKHYYWWFGGGKEKGQKKLSPEYREGREISGTLKTVRKIYNELKRTNPEKARRYFENHREELQLTAKTIERTRGPATSSLNVLNVKITNLKKLRKKAIEQKDKDRLKQIDERINTYSEKIKELKDHTDE